MKLRSYLALITLTTLIATSTSARADSLAERLIARENKSPTKSNPERKAAFKAGIVAVDESKVVEKAKQVGDDAPDFTLKNATGKEITLSEQLKNGPVVLTWYRGGWCPYCNIALHAMQEVLPEIKAAGATLLALSPELPDKVLTTTEKSALEFEVLTDLNHNVAHHYDIIFELTPEVEAIYDERFDLVDYNGEDAGTKELPLAATYIIGEDGKILWAFLHHDYHKRAEPADIVKFLQERKAAAKP